MTNVVSDFKALADCLAQLLEEQTQLIHQLTKINGEGASAE